jgi:beta-aspartyl-peptidase (threonine type)
MVLRGGCFLIAVICSPLSSSQIPFSNFHFPILLFFFSMQPSLIVHGGAWDIPDDAVDACKSGCLRALHAGWNILKNGGHALDAIEAAIIVLEDDPTFDSGFGSHLTLDGHVECDAIVMDAATLRAGSVAGLRRVKNPIQAARAVLEKCPHMMLVSEGAENFASAHGVRLCNPEDLISPAEREAWLRCSKDSHAAENHRGHEQGTVGAVALDQHRRLFAATSTGGTCCKLPGRVGDSPLIGCGCYADSETGGVSCTGYGEAIMRVVMAKTAADFLRPATSSPVRAAQAAVQLLANRGTGTGGLILLDKNGNPGFAFNTPRMAFGYVNSESPFFTSV